MKISTKGRYATRALVELAIREDDQPVRLKEIATCQKLSIRYLENLFRILKKAHFVKGTVGMRGGYELAKSAEDISVLDILEAVEGNISSIECVKDPGSCTLLSDCITHNVWKKLDLMIRKELGSISLQSLADKNQQASSSTGVMKH